MLRERIKQVMAQTWGIAADSIPDDAAMEQIEQWTSLGHLEVMMAVEMEFRVSIPTSAMFDLLSIEAIEDFLAEKGVAKAA